MKKLFYLLITGLISLTTANATQNIYDFVVKDIYGSEYDFSQLEGKKVMIVNTASKCGFTSQYAEMQTLYEKYKEKDFVIAAFPANNFMNQEPGTNEEIANFCTSEFNVSFPLMSKISVKGDDIHPVYQWLTMKSKNNVMDSEVKWNFQKYLINRDGSLHGVLGTRTSPMDESIINWIKAD